MAARVRGNAAISMDVDAVAGGNRFRGYRDYPLGGFEQA